MKTRVHDVLRLASLCLAIGLIPFSVKFCHMALESVLELQKGVVVFTLFMSIVSQPGKESTQTQLTYA